MTDVMVREGPAATVCGALESLNACTLEPGCFANKPFCKRLYVCLRLGKQTQTVYSSNKLKLRGWFVCVCLDGGIGRFLVLQVYVNDHPNPKPEVPEAAVSQSARDFAACT
jgi:hypothetical protein